MKSCQTNEILQQGEWGGLNIEESELKLCLNFAEIFYLERDHLTLTDERKHSIVSNNAKHFFTKLYRYSHINK